MTKSERMTAREKKNERERESFYLLIYSPDGYKSWGWTSRSQEPRTPPGYFLLMEGVQVTLTFSVCKQWSMYAQRPLLW